MLLFKAIQAEALSCRSAAVQHCSSCADKRSRHSCRMQMPNPQQRNAVGYNVLALWFFSIADAAVSY